MRTDVTGLASAGTRSFTGEVQQCETTAEFTLRMRTDSTQVIDQTLRLRRQQAAPAIGRHETLTILAGYLLEAGCGSVRRVELAQHCGTLWGGPHNREVFATADRLLKEIEDAASTCGLRCRTGRLLLKRGRPQTS